MRTPGPMRTFVKLLLRKMTASQWVIRCAFVERKKVYALQLKGQDSSKNKIVHRN